MECLFCHMKVKKEFRIKKAEYGSAEYEGLRDLWCEVFDDTAAYVDAFYDNFSDVISGYVGVQHCLTLLVFLVL